jgi:hypothetical protein
MQPDKVSFKTFLDLLIRGLSTAGVKVIVDEEVTVDFQDAGPALSYLD